ncbi:hypothetical protein GCM10027270_16750 [Nocardioides ginkgobilobae]
MWWPESGPVDVDRVRTLLALDAHERGVLAGWLHVLVGLVVRAS